MKKLIVLALALILAVPALVYSDTFSFRLGYNMPKTSVDPNSLWDVEFSQMNFKKADFRGAIYGLSYEHFVTPQLSFSLTVETATKDVSGVYMDWLANTVDSVDYAFPQADFFGDYIPHVFHFSMTPLELSVKLTPLGRKSRIIPYVGGGVGLYFWTAGIRGETIDFSVPITYTDADLVDWTVYAIQQSDSRESHMAIGYHAFGGIQVPIGYRFTVEAEARYRWAKGSLTRWFTGFSDFELGGLALTAGFSYWF